MQGERAAILGGDRRMQEVVACLHRQGYDVRAVGLPRQGLPEGALSPTVDAAVQGARLLILPVQPVGEDGRVYTPPGLGPITLTPSLMGRLAPGATVLAGLASNWLRSLCANANVPLVEYREADEFAIWNSVPSAEGAIQMAMEATPFTIFGSRSLVIGFGRTGKTLALLLRGLFSDVAIAVRREDDYARVWTQGYRYVSAHGLEEAVGTIDLLFNTAPAPVVTRAVLAALPKHAMVIDLATAPGGTDFDAAEELGICAKLAPGLPGIVAPVTAGRIIAELAVRYLRTDSGKEGR